MRAVAVFPADKTVRLIDHPEPRPTRPGEALIQMVDVGICGTDREVARCDYGTPPPGSPYLVVGHESLGRVLEVGTGVERVQPGDLVVTTVRRPCPHASCRACTRGRQDFCFTGDFSERGIRGLHGFMTERVVEHERYLHVVPRSLASVGVLVEPLTIAEKALIQVKNVQDRLPWAAVGRPEGDPHGRSAVVLGAGPVGLLGCLALLARGLTTTVYSNEPADSVKARWVRSVGATYVSALDVPVAALSAELGGIDLVYEATGAAALAFRALETLGPNGVFIFTGVPGRRAPIELDAGLIMRKLVLENQLVFGTVNAGAEAFEAAISDLALFHARWPEALESLITSREPPEAHADLLLGPRSGIKPVMRFAEL